MSTKVDIHYEFWDAYEAMGNVNGGCLLFGASQSGKGVLLRYMLSLHPRRYYNVLAMSGTASSTGDLDMVPPVFIHDNINDDAIQGFVSMCTERTAQRTEQANQIITQYAHDPETANALLSEMDREYTHNLVIIDDLSEDRTRMSSPYVKALFSKGRQYNIVTIVVMHDAKGVLPFMRGNPQFVWAFNAEDALSKKNIHTEYADYFGTGAEGNEQFEEAFKKLAGESYCCMVVDKRNGTGQTGIQRLKGFRAPPAETIEPYVLGHPDMWATNDLYYDPDNMKRISSVAAESARELMERSTTQGALRTTKRKTKTAGPVVRHVSPYESPAAPPRPAPSPSFYPQPQPQQQPPYQSQGQQLFPEQLQRIYSVIPEQDMQILMQYHAGQQGRVEWLFVVAEYLVRKNFVQRAHPQEPPSDTLCRILPSLLG